MTRRHAPPQPERGQQLASSPEFLALAARYRVAVLLKELARLSLCEFEVRAELSRLLGTPGPAAAAAQELAAVLQRLGGEGGA